MRPAPEIAAADLDQASSTDVAPYVVVTADKSSRNIIDDGVFVEELDTNHETYRVGVCVADTSNLYADRQLFDEVVERTETKYPTDDGEPDYVPMLDEEVARALELRKGKIRSSLIISCEVGKDLPPSNLAVNFGHIEVAKNFNYNNFGRECRYGKRRYRYGRASAFLLQHLGYNPGGDSSSQAKDVESVHAQLIHVPPHEAWNRGSRINESFMVAVNHLIGQMMDEEGRPAIYRLCDRPNGKALWLPSRLGAAYYSATAGPHTALNLNPYCRVTSPLRRLEDFMMNHHLRQRYEGVDPSARDFTDNEIAIRGLNQRVLSACEDTIRRAFDQPVDVMPARQLQTI